MEIGMLWYDPDAKRELADKVVRAVEFYRAKYGVRPTECFVNPTMLPANAPEITGGVRLRPANAILKNHFWIGIEDGASR
jgi:hypothetical protein